MTTSQTKQRTHREDATFRQGRTDDGNSRTHRIRHILESNTHNVTKYQKHGKHKLIDSKCMTSIISLLQVIHAFCIFGHDKDPQVYITFFGNRAPCKFSIFIRDNTRSSPNSGAPLQFGRLYPTGYPPIPTSV